MQSGKSGVYTFTGSATGLQAYSFSINENAPVFQDSYNPKNTTAEFVITIVDTGTKGATMTVDIGTVETLAKSPTGFVKLVFTSSTYTGLALPSTQAAFDSAFATTAGSFTWDPSNGPAFNGPITEIDGISVPEPSSFVLVSAATCGVGLLISRRRKLGKI